jgi:subtilisin-like proprotein convertase family protein
VRRRIAVLFVAGFLAAAGVAVGSSAAGAGSPPAPKLKTITETFSKTSAITIPSSGPSGKATPYPSEINVSGSRQGKIKDVNFTLKNYSHTYPDDVAVLLEGPKGQDTIVMSDVGGKDAVNNITIVLDDEATGTLPDNTQLIGGTFKPTQGKALVTNASFGHPRPDVFPGPARFPPYDKALSVFDGTKPNGTWSLYVFDDTDGASGELAGGWSIEIEAKVKK